MQLVPLHNDIGDQGYEALAAAVVGHPSLVELQWIEGRRVAGGCDGGDGGGGGGGGVGSGDGSGGGGGSANAFCPSPRIISAHRPCRDHRLPAATQAAGTTRDAVYARRGATPVTGGGGGNGGDSRRRGSAPGPPTHHRRGDANNRCRARAVTPRSRHRPLPAGWQVTETTGEPPPHTPRRRPLRPSAVSGP